MKLKLALLFTCLVVAMAGCGGSDTTNSNTNSTNTNTTAGSNTAPPTDVGLAAEKTPTAATTNDAPTLAPVVHAYYDALKKKDAAAVRKVMAEGFIQSAESGMEEEGDDNLVVYLTKYDKMPQNRMEVRNEQISGNRGTAELKGGSYNDWVKITFINEGGTWKITNEVPK